MNIPRDYRSIGSILNADYATFMLEHPEAFDCTIWPAKSPEHDEILSDVQPSATLLDSDERAQEYDAPVAGRAMLIPTPELDFDATESGGFEGFTYTSEAINLLLSVPNLRRYSLVQFLEYLSLEGEETVERTVYIRDIRPMGRTLGAGMVYVCYPLPALGEIPETEPTQPSESTETEDENTPHAGIL